MEWILLILLIWISRAVSESAFACEPNTIRPGNGLPYYEIINKSVTYSEAEYECRSKGAELFTSRQNNAFVQETISNISRTWLSAKRRYWTHVSLYLGLAFEPWAEGHPVNKDDNCAYVMRTKSTVNLYSAPCSEEYSVICMKEDLALCNWEHVYEYMCYFIPEVSQSPKSFADSQLACEEESGHLVGIFKQKQLQWISDTFRDTFWTGYNYNKSSTDLFWYDGNPVKNITSEFPLYTFDCVIINDSGDLNMQNCNAENPFICVLEIPYATRNTDCRKFGEECVCYWNGDRSRNFDEAMEYCLSDGGTLAYPDSEEKLSYLRDMTEESILWVGISDGNTKGVYRRSDTLAVTWVPWTHEFGPYAYSGYDCIKSESSGFNSYFCSSEYKFVCQSLPDSYLYECTRESGCLRSFDYWDVDNTNLTYKGYADLTVQNVKSLDRCWDLCVSYIGFSCLIVKYSSTTKECYLMKKISLTSKSGANQGRKRTRRVLNPDSYCIAETGLLLDLDNAKKECANRIGWKIPVITDLTMLEKISINTWISAKDTDSLPRVFKTLEGDYLPYSKWGVGQPAASLLRCVYASYQQMSVSQCDTPRNVMCYAEKVNVCRDPPDISHGYKAVDTATGNVLYTCEDGYFMPTLNVTYLNITCTCDWSSKLSDVTNCTAIHCPSPVDHPFGTLINMTGTGINDTALYKCPFGYVVSETGSIYYTLSCKNLPDTVSGNWSDPPTLEVMNCTQYPNLKDTIYSVSSRSVGSVIELVCIDWYWIPELNNNTVHVTCVMDKSGHFASWCWVPPCKEIICPQPPTVVMATHVVERNKTTYTCQPDYRIQGTSTSTTEIFCEYDENFNATWQSMPTCEAIDCSSPPEVQRADILFEPVNSYKVGAVITYLCCEGFTVYQDGEQLGNLSQFKKTCEIDYVSLTGKWTGNYSCEVPQCGIPPELLHSNVTLSSLTVGSIANYTCDRNYIMNSSKRKWAISTCVLGEAGSLPYWTATENCSAIHCNDPGNISNAVIESVSVNIDDLTTYCCKSGYKVRDIEPATNSFSIVCELTNSTLSASWSEASECEVVMCSEPPGVLNSDVLVNGYNVGDTANYTCYPEFISKSGQGWQSTCVLDAKDGVRAVWDTIEECTYMKTTTLTPEITYDEPLIRQCPVPNTSVGYTTQAKNLFLESKVSYVAKTGYFFRNGGTIRSSICSLGGHWTFTSPAVKRYSCPLLPPIVEATTSTDENYVGTEVKIECKNLKAKMENGLSSVTIRCTYKRKWTFIPKTCEIQRCGPFEVVEHSRLIAFHNDIGGLATIECNLSYRFADGARTKSFRCLADLTWEASERCYLNVCPQLQLPENGVISTDTALEGSTVEIRCLPGFVFADRKQIQVITCNSSFQWSDLPRVCEVVRCPKAPQITNGNRTSSATLFNSTITYTCDETYRLQYGYQQITIRCEQNAEWTYGNLSCGKDRCPPVPSVKNASPSTFLALNGTTVIYTCDTGYIFPSNQTTLSIKCNGVTWNMTLESCQKVTCPKLNLSHATMFGNGSTFGDVVKLVCDEGYIYNNNITGVMKCKANSQWSGDTKGCMPIDCGPPPDVKYSVRNVPAFYHYGTSVSYECITNYWFKKGITKKSIMCTRYGKWSSIPGNCTPILCPPIPVWNDMEANTTNNVAGTFVNVGCTRDELNHSVISVCNSFGEWQPPLDNCKTDKISVYEPEPKEAVGASSIGLAVTSILVLVSIVLGISDAPVLLSAVKGRSMKRSRERSLHSHR